MEAGMPKSRLRALGGGFISSAVIMDAAIHREWELSLGRRSANAKIASLFCELHSRLTIVGLTQGNNYALPLIQTDIAECLGLTHIHVNRTLKELRERGLVEFRNGAVKILDLHRLAEDGEFDPRIFTLNAVYAKYC
jgi:hypothetical protein